MKDILAVTGNYTDKSGQEKAEFLKVGAIGVSQAGKEYVILDPTVNIAGALFKQNLNNHAQGKSPQKGLMCSVFDRQQSQPQQGQAPQQQAAQATQQPPPVVDGMDDDSIPF